MVIVKNILTMFSYRNTANSLLSEWNTYTRKCRKTVLVVCVCVLKTVWISLGRRHTHVICIPIYNIYIFYSTHFAHGEMQARTHLKRYYILLWLLYYRYILYIGTYYLFIIMCVWTHAQILNAKATSSAGKETLGECATLGRNNIIYYLLIIILCDSSRVFNCAFGRYCRYSL